MSEENHRIGGDGVGGWGTRKDRKLNYRKSFELTAEPKYMYNLATGRYTGWAKKVSLIIFGITLSSASQLSYFLARVHCRKFATREYVASPPNVVCVTTLPCKILTTAFFTLNSIHCCKKVQFLLW